MSVLDSIQKAVSERNLQEVLRLAMEYFHADTGSIHLLEPDGALHLKAASAGIPEPVLKAVAVVPVGKGMAGLAVERKQPVTVCNLQGNSSDARPGAKASGMESALVVPVLHGDKAIGALGIASRQARTFTSQETDVLMNIGRAIAVQGVYDQR
jgi:GAF domain-containing protein